MPNWAWTITRFVCPVCHKPPSSKGTAGPPALARQPPCRYAHIVMSAKIYTRRGDGGRTDLPGGRRVDKGAQPIELLGQLDELNAAIGLARAAGAPAAVDDDLSVVQGELLRLGAIVAGANTQTLEQIDATTVAGLERRIDDHEKALEPLHSFVLPGGSTSGAQLHLARCICRRAERELSRLGSRAMPASSAYLNRLSDLLFVLARRANALAGMPEPVWRGRGTAR